jgi:hypothetical protein
MWQQVLEFRAAPSISFDVEVDRAEERLIDSKDIVKATMRSAPGYGAVAV